MQLDLTTDEREVLDAVREAARRAPQGASTEDWWRLLHEQGLLEISPQTGDDALMCAVVAEAIGHELVPVHFGAYMTLQCLFEQAAEENPPPVALAAAAKRWHDEPGRGFASGHELTAGVAVIEELSEDLEFVVIRRGTGWSVLDADAVTIGGSSEWTGAPVLHKVTFDPASPIENVNGRDANLLNVVLHAAELVGVAREASQRSREYLQAREQFGRPIGAFQALQHRMVDVVAEIAAGEALVEFATWRWGDQPDDAATAAWVHAAAGLAAESGLQALSEAFTFHGGMAMTDELWVHRWYRRAVRLAAFQGDASTHFERTGDALADGLTMVISPGLTTETQS